MAENESPSSPQDTSKNSSGADATAEAETDHQPFALMSVEPKIQAAEPTKPSRPPWLRSAIIAGTVFTLVFGVLFGTRYWGWAGSHQSTDDAFTTSDIVQITPQVSGNIQSVLVNDNEHVQAGQLLVALDDESFRADVNQAAANLDVARATATGATSTVRLTADTGDALIAQAAAALKQADSAIIAAQDDSDKSQAAVATAKAMEQTACENARTAKAAVEAARAAVVSAEADREKTAKDKTRYAMLMDEQAISIQQADVANAAATSARAALDKSRQQVSQAVAQLAAAEASIRAAEATVRQNEAQLRSAHQNVRQMIAKRSQAVGQLIQAKTAPTQVAVSQANRQSASAKIRQAQAALDTAQIALRRTRLTAPAAGTISKKTAEIGHQVAVGQPLMAIVPDNDIWVVANFKETQLRDVHPGQRVEIDVDTFNGHPFKGRVDSISAGTGATFALLPPDNSTGNFTKVVQRVPVKVVLDSNQRDLNRLRAGLSVLAIIDTGR
jgi:membrane fusion protein (multidrug efflux system)